MHQPRKWLKHQNKPAPGEVVWVGAAREADARRGSSYEQAGAHLEDVRGAAQRRHAAVTVLRDARAGRGRDHAGARRDVHGSDAVAAGADDVDDVVRRVHGERLGAHARREARQLIGGLTCGHRRGLGQGSPGRRGRR